jgi:hypothetical protein
LLLMFLGVAGCNAEVSVGSQTDTNFEAGHDCVLVHATAAEAKKNPLTGEIQALWLRHDPSYANVIINNGKRSWDRPHFFEHDMEYPLDR